METDIIPLRVGRNYTLKEDILFHKRGDKAKVIEFTKRMAIIKVNNFQLIVRRGVLE